MGWCESPPFFCASTETAQDIITLLLEEPHLPAHPMETIMLQKCCEHECFPAPERQVQLIKVYVDDFIGATNDLSFHNLQHMSRAMLHGIHSIFPPPKVTGHCGEDPVSESKLAKGEGTWEYRKEILGWIFDGEAYTIQLPPEKCATICSQLRQLRKSNRASLNRFQRVAGRLQHAAMGMPGGKALFTPIDMAMKGDPEYITLTPVLRQCLEDWQYFINHMKRNPTSVLQLVCHSPHYINYTDSCGLGTGGICSAGDAPLTPFLWQLEWPAPIQQALVTDTNRHGTITINDLELAGAVLGFLVLEWIHTPLRHRHVATFCDNTSAVSWAYKLRNSTSLIAGRLLRLLGIRIHASEASSIVPHHICGVNNIMADVVSRAFKNGKFFEASHNLVAYFNKHFPLPKSTSWTEFHLPKELSSPVIACLLGKQQHLASLLRLMKHGKNIGESGRGTQRCATSTLSSHKNSSH